MNSDMLKDAMKDRLDISDRVSFSLPDHTQLANGMLGKLGGPFGTAQGHIGSIMSAMLPQWFDEVPVSPKVRG